jgi:hypothetical protein
MAHSIAEEITEAVNNLPPELQKKVLEYARGLDQDTKPDTRPKGVPGKDLLRFAGTISKEDLEVMSRVIEEDCERIDESSWTDKSNW